jgi:hypothetical protein
VNAKAEKLYVDTEELPHDIERRYNDAQSYLSFKWAFFSHIMYDDMEVKFIVDNPYIPVAATDSYHIFINHTGFVNYGIEDVLEVVFVDAHEVSHRVLYDVEAGYVWQDMGCVPIGNGETLPYDHTIMGRAMDYRINAMLIDSGVGKAPKGVLYDKTLSEKGEESCVEIYQKLMKRPRSGLTGFDVHLRLSREQAKKDKGRREQTIIAAHQIQKRLKQQALPGAMMRQIQEIIEPKVRWEQHLRTVMTRHGGTKITDWAKQDRRLAGRNPAMFYAGVRHKGAGPIVFVGDNSGSITPHVTSVFAGEASGIVAELKPERFIAMWCDAAVTRVDELEEPLDLMELALKWKKDGVGGGGGTDFRPAFDKVAELGIKPDMLVFFTDGHGTFPKEAPDYPVVWGMTTGKKPPFGEVVRVEVS